MYKLILPRRGPFYGNGEITLCAESIEEIFGIIADGIVLTFSNSVLDKEIHASGYCWIKIDNKPYYLVSIYLEQIKKRIIKGGVDLNKPLYVKCEPTTEY